MKTLKCSEVAGIDCDFTATGETDAEVTQKLQEHGESAHADMMSALTEEQKTAMGLKINQLLVTQ